MENQVAVEEVEPNVVSIRYENLAEANKAIAKLIKKAHRYGCPDLNVEIGERYTQSRKVIVRTVDGFKEIYAFDYWVDITATGSAPRVGDYTFVARVTNDLAGVIIDAVPNQQIDPRFRIGDTHACEHCSKKRNRKDVYVVQDESGEQVQVGKSCLRDFLGTDSPESVLRKFQWLRDFSEISDDSFGGGRIAETRSIHELLSYTSTVIRLCGWVSGGEARNSDTLHSTASEVGLLYRRLDTKTDKDAIAFVKRLREENNEKDDEKATQVIEYFRSLEGATSDYILNLKTLLSIDICEAGRVSYICSAIAAFNKEQDIATERKAREEAAKLSEFIGTVGQRIKGQKVTVQKIRVIGEGYAWGSENRVLISFVTEDGCQLSWFTEGTKSLSAGDEITLDFTVKSHSTYNNAKQTLITRAKPHTKELEYENN